MAAILSLESELCDSGRTSVANPTGGVLTGELSINNNLYGFAYSKSPNNDEIPTGNTANTMSAGDFYTFIYRADRVKVPKSTTASVNQFDRAYYDPGDQKFHGVTSTGRVALGRWLADYSATATEGQIDFDGDLHNKLAGV